MRSYFVFRHLPICHDANKRVKRIVGKCSAVIRKTRRARRVVRQNVWEQCSRHSLRLRRRISPCVLKSVREPGKEAPIMRGLTRKVGISFFDKYDRLCRTGSALYLDPCAAITWRKRAGPQANLFCSQSRVGYFKNDAAHIFVSEEIVAGELQLVLRAFHVAEERVAAPAGEEAGIACLRNPRLASYGNCSPPDDQPPSIAGTGGLSAINAA